MCVFYKKINKNKQKNIKKKPYEFGDLPKKKFNKIR